VFDRMQFHKCCIYINHKKKFILFLEIPCHLLKTKVFPPNEPREMLKDLFSGVISHRVQSPSMRSMASSSRLMLVPLNNLMLMGCSRSCPQLRQNVERRPLV